MSARKVMLEGGRAESTWAGATLAGASAGSDVEPLLYVSGAPLRLTFLPATSPVS